MTKKITLILPWLMGLLLGIGCTFILKDIINSLFFQTSSIQSNETRSDSSPAKYHLGGYIVSRKDAILRIQDLAVEKKEGGTHTVLLSPNTQYVYRKAGTKITSDSTFIIGNKDDLKENIYIYLTTLDDPSLQLTLTAPVITYSLFNPFVR